MQQTGRRRAALTTELTLEAVDLAGLVDKLRPIRRRSGVPSVVLDRLTLLGRLCLVPLRPRPVAELGGVLTARRGHAELCPGQGLSHVGRLVLARVTADADQPLDRLLVAGTPGTRADLLHPRQWRSELIDARHRRRLWDPAARHEPLSQLVDAPNASAREGIVRDGTRRGPRKLQVHPDAVRKPHEVASLLLLYDRLGASRPLGLGGLGDWRLVAILVLALVRLVTRRWRASRRAGGVQTLLLLCSTCVPRLLLLVLTETDAQQRPQCVGTKLRVAWLQVGPQRQQCKPASSVYLMLDSHVPHCREQQMGVALASEFGVVGLQVVGE
eukprot:5808749-Prymnesium_polylepis.2